MADKYQTVTNRIVAMLEAGTPPWRKSWNGSGSQAVLHRPLRVNGVPYTGANVIHLWSAAMIHGYQSCYWMTKKSAEGLGATVRPEARWELAFYMGKATKKAKKPTEDDKTVSFLKSYCVYNADSIEGLPAHYYGDSAAPRPVKAGHERNPAVDAFVGTLGVPVRHGGDRAYYMPSTDSVQMPQLEDFYDAEAYYATLLHEMTHSTGHATRCDRQFGKRFGDNAYAMEELVAELGAAFMCADLSISNAPREDHASYIAHWIKVLKADSRAIFRAASAAEAAARWMHGRQPAIEEAGDAPYAEEELAMAV